MDETQKSVNDWIEESYPGASLKRKLKHAFEEMTELTVGAETNLTLEDIIAVVSHAWHKSQQSPQNPQTEVGDMRIALTGIASTLGVNEQDALNATMKTNRERSLAERQARESTKQTLSIFSESDQGGTPSQPAP